MPTDERPEGEHGYLDFHKGLDASYYQGAITFERDTGEVGYGATPTHSLTIDADEYDRLVAWVERMREKERREHAGE